METVPNREKPLLLGKGTLLVSCPRNHRRMPVETMAYREVGAWSDGVEVVPPSYVTIRVKSSLIREGALLPPVVRRCPVGNRVFETQRTGRVALVGAAAPLFGEERRRVCCKVVAGSFQCPAAAGRRPGGTGCVTDDERADG
jgi:hypothetical protein